MSAPTIAMTTAATIDGIAPGRAVRIQLPTDPDVWLYLASISNPDVWLVLAVTEHEALILSSAGDARLVRRRYLAATPDRFDFGQLAAPTLDLGSVAYVLREQPGAEQRRAQLGIRYTVVGFGDTGYVHLAPLGGGIGRAYRRVPLADLVSLDVTT